MSIYSDGRFGRFFDAYLECALWASDLDGGEFADEALEILGAHARSYFARVHFYVASDEDATPFSGDAFAQLGRDFWLDQNGHGAGARDGHWPKYGVLFQAAAQKYPEISLYRDDDDLIDCQ